MLKIRTLRSLVGALGAVLLSTALFSALAGTDNGGPDVYPLFSTFFGVGFGQIAAIAFGTTAVTAEFRGLDGAGQLVAEVSPYAVDLDWGDIDDPEEIAAVVADLGRATATMHAAADDTSGESPGAVLHGAGHRRGDHRR